LNKLLIIPALGLFGLLAACSSMSNSGASGIADRAGVGISSAGNGGFDPHLSSTYQNELRAENSN
jgi:hypothetical protein